MDANGLTAARAARDAGIQQAAQHAEEVNPRWGDRALDLLQDYIASSGRPQTFTSENFRTFAAAMDLPNPPHLRAFGAVFQRAARAGLIVKVGITESKAAHCHCAHVAAWRAA